MAQEVNMTNHELQPTRANLHGTFSREIPAVLEIDPGDSVRFTTLDAGWGLEAMHADGSRRRIFEPLDPITDAGHALCGPVAVRGAQPGDTLVVRIDELRTGTFGFTGAGGPNPTRVEPFGLSTDLRLLLRWELDREALVATNHLGHKVAMRPFLGVMGLPPDEPGHHSTAPPRVTGGNLDCKELVPGVKLFLPVAVEGGLFSTGDGHAAQGDGELSGTAIECPMESAVLTFDLLKGVAYETPRALTPDAWLTFGVNEDLDAAMYQATNGILDLIMELYGVERALALALASTVVDLRITQVVNGVKGVHAILPHGAIR
jgi:acetamidase/formamidase